MADVQQEAYVSMNTHAFIFTQGQLNTPHTPMTLLPLSLCHTLSCMEGRAPTQREGIEQPAAYVPLVREHSFKDRERERMGGDEDRQRQKK